MAEPWKLRLMVGILIDGVLLRKALIFERISTFGGMVAGVAGSGSVRRKGLMSGKASISPGFHGFLVRTSL